MSSPNPSDPRLLLPEWLRDGDVPAAARTAVDATPDPAVEHTEGSVAVDLVEIVSDPVFSPPVTPFSDRLSLDTRLDPGQLVSAADLPKWLGGLEPVGRSPVVQSLSASTATPRAQTPATIEEPEPYEGVDAPADGVIDVDVNGWIIIGAAAGLLVLLIAAFKLYLS